MTRPAPFLSPNQSGVGLDHSQLGEDVALEFLRLGDRQQRRAAQRWLVRRQVDVPPKKSSADRGQGNET